MTQDTILLQYVKKRLHQWASWYDSGNGHQIGHATCSLEYRLMTEGMIGKNTGQKPLPCNEEAEEIEALVRELAQHTPDIAFSLRCHYFSTYAFRRKIKNMKFAQSKMEHYVAMGHQWLAWQLDATRKK